MAGPGLSPSHGRTGQGPSRGPYQPLWQAAAIVVIFDGKTPKHCLLQRVRRRWALHALLSENTRGLNPESVRPRPMRASLGGRRWPPTVGYGAAKSDATYCSSWKNKNIGKIGASKPFFPRAKPKPAKKTAGFRPRRRSCCAGWTAPLGRPRFVNLTVIDEVI